MSEESAESLAKLDELETWSVAPTMTRGSRKKPVTGAPVKKVSAEAAGGKKRRRIKLVRRRVGKDKPKKKAAEKKPEFGAEPGQINRSSQGRELIQERLSELHSLEAMLFKETPLWSTDGFCRMKYGPAKMVQWKDVLEKAPACFECMHLVFDLLKFDWICLILFDFL